MRIEIVNERLLPRFGVDRLLVLLGRRLVARGHEVAFTSLRNEPRLLNELGRNTTLDLPAGLDVVTTEREVAQLMRRHLAEHRPDALVCGGWPFFRTAREAGELGVASLFIDAGAVAQDGMPEPLLAIQRELRRVRQSELPGIDRILPISRFICGSQTLPDRGCAAGVRTVLLGTDHMAHGLFPAGDQEDGAALLKRLHMLRDSGVPLLLLLGRFEAVGYKNSPAAYDILRTVRVAVPKARLLILDAGADCAIPGDLAQAVLPLGQPDDATLQAVMELCSLGLSPSLWEGFNFPIVEMQQLRRPALAFNLGAHPEVIAHPWLLCDSNDEMARKAIRLLTGSAPAELEPALLASSTRLPWSQTLGAWEDEIADAVRQRQAGDSIPPPAQVLLVDVTNAAVDPANSGVMRVTRQLCERLQRRPDLRLVFARWDAGARTYRLLEPWQRERLAAFGGPIDRRSGLAGGAVNDVDSLLQVVASSMKSAVLFMPEVMLDGGGLDRLAWARGRGMRMTAILHDIIPIDYPKFCDAQVANAFPSYIEAMLRYDRIWSVSDFSRQRLEAYAAARGLDRQAMLETLWLPGQFGTASRVTTPPEPSAEIRILCVSTLEPRKNHKTLLQAWRLLRQRRPELPLRLTLVGNQYAGAPEIWQAVERAAAEDPALTYAGVLDDAALRASFAGSAFTVYCSLVEGFGLPVLESLWLGRPCLTHHDGVMAELATRGGCLTTDMRDPAQLADAIEQLATDEELLGRLTTEAVTRRIGTWKDYARDIGDGLVGLARENSHAA